MALSVVSLTLLEHDWPRAGHDFRLVVELDRPVEVGDGVVEVLLEKQRIVANNGGFAELRPTGGEYFDLDPAPIPVPRGQQAAISNPIRVKEKPQAPEGETPVTLPETLLFSGFIKRLSDGFCPCAVQIDPPKRPTEARPTRAKPAKPTKRK